jgi:hypothetical protein
LSSSKRIPSRNFVLAGALFLLIVQLNFYFAWTSHVGAAVPRGFTPPPQVAPPVSTPPVVTALPGLTFIRGGGSSPPRSFLLSEVNDFVKIQLGIPGLSSFLTKLAAGGEDNVRANTVGNGNRFVFLGPPGSLAMKYLIDIEVILFTLAVFVISLVLFWKRGIGVSVLRALQVTSLAVLPLGLEIFFFDRPEFNVHASDIQVQAGLAWFTNADVLLLSSTILCVTVFVELMRHKKGKEPALSQPIK